MRTHRPRRSFRRFRRAISALLALGALLGAFGPSGAETAPAPADWKRPLRDVTFERTPERLERGRYLAHGVLQCLVCHSERDTTQLGAPPRADALGAGRVFRDEPGRRVVSSNITPDVETGVGGWTDDMLARAIREGVGNEDRPLHPQMPYEAYRGLSDEDLASVVAYLRTLDPVRNELPKTELPADEIERIRAKLRPLSSPVPAPAGGSAEERGAYLISIADCAGCHTATAPPRHPGAMAGGEAIERLGLATAFSTNVTNDPTGLYYDAPTFVEIIRDGRYGTLKSVMPWTAFRNLTDEDLTDIHAALRNCASVPHFVNNLTPPADCVACGRTHGFGELNRLVEPEAVRVDEKTLGEYVGRYVEAATGEAITIARDGKRLTYREGDGEANLRMYPQSDGRFLVPGAPAPVRFERSPDGIVSRLVTHEFEPRILGRTE